MDAHKDLKKLVIITIKNFESKKIEPTAKELFMKVSETKPRVEMKGFRSFVRVLNSFSGIKIERHDPFPQIYKSK